MNRLLDGLLPTRHQPVPELASVAEWSVLGDRGVAAAIDLLLCYVFLELPVIYVASEVFTASFDALGAMAPVLSVAFLVPVYATYGFAFEWLYGRTPGKVNRGLVVVMADGRECTVRASAVRNLLRYVDLLGVPPLVVGLASALVADGRRVGDVAAGTVVVRARASEEVSGPVRADMDTSAGARPGSRREAE